MREHKLHLESGMFDFVRLNRKATIKPRLHETVLASVPQKLSISALLCTLYYFHSNVLAAERFAKHDFAFNKYKQTCCVFRYT